MPHFKLLIAYDGTDFHGWQMQEGIVTISSVLQNAFHDAFKKDIQILGASRTDAGVHAAGQVASFTVDLDVNLDPTTWALVWNRRLPPAINVVNIEQVPIRFNPCLNVVEKIYHYNLFRTRPSPFLARFGWWCKFIDYVDFDKFAKGLSFYVGEHDFRSFCKIESEDISSVRKIHAINLEKIPSLNAVRIVVKGPSFLHFQIRRMIGYALDIARQPNISIDFIQHMLKNPNPQQTLIKAEASGLCLRKIIYHDTQPSPRLRRAGPVGYSLGESNGVSSGKTGSEKI